LLCESRSEDFGAFGEGGKGDRFAFGADEHQLIGSGCSPLSDESPKRACLHYCCHLFLAFLRHVGSLLTCLGQE
jgi:hypothetical protein